MQDNIKIEANLLEVLGHIEGGALMSCNLQIGDKSWDTVYWLQESAVGVLTFSDELLLELGIESEESLDWYNSLVNKLDQSIDDKKSIIEMSKSIGNVEGLSNVNEA